MKTLQVNMGFVTNSSSVIHFFDKKILEHPEVAAFMKRYGLNEGMIGNLTNRNSCTSVGVSVDHKKEMVSQLDNEYNSASETMKELSEKDDSVFVAYGDEYTSVANELARIIERVFSAEKYDEVHLGRQEMH